MDEKDYIERFMGILSEDERETYKDIEVRVVTEGEHVLGEGFYVVGGDAKVKIPNPGWPDRVDVALIAGEFLRVSTRRRRLFCDIL